MDNPLSLASVLVVEDELFSQQFIVQMLESLSVGQVLTATNGLEALEILGARQAGVDLVITDVEMPEMGGYELVRRLRLGGIPGLKDVPIIILTANDTEKNLQHAKVLKINSFFVKPPSKAVFEKTIHRIIVDKILDIADGA